MEFSSIVVGKIPVLLLYLLYHLLTTIAPDLLRIDEHVAYPLKDLEENL